MINGRELCKSCEKRLLNIDINTDFYEYYKECIRKNIVNTTIRGEDIKCQDFHF